jgi:hypothetical protein
MNTKKLIPVTGALITGLVGIASATCFGFLTHTCHAADDVLVSSYVSCSGGGHDLYATGYWYGRDAYELTDPADWAALGYSGWTQTTYCHGPASYIDCYGYPHTIDDYQDTSSTQFTEPIPGYQMPWACEY